MLRGMDLPSEADIRHLIASYAELKASHGPAFSDSELVLPTADFFPDEFRLDGESVASFMKRMLSYAPVAADLPVGLRFIQPDEASGAGSCSSGACGTGGRRSRAGSRRRRPVGRRRSVMSLSSIVSTPSGGTIR